MSQAFSLTPRGLKTVSASNTVTVPMAATTQLLELNVLDGVEKISFQVDNITQALDAFVVEGRVHQDASYFTIANAAGDFSAPSGRVLAANGALVTLAAAASGRFDLDVSGLYSIRVSASAAADSAVVTIYASGSAAGSGGGGNTTLVAGDIEIGAVEIKDGTTDTRGTVKAASTLPVATDTATVVTIREVGTALTPNANTFSVQRPAVTQVVSTALEASHVLKASAGQLVQLTVFSSRTSSQYILVMNSTSLPGDGAVTLLYPPIPIGAASIVVLDLPAPLVASTGITVCNSSTGTFTKTIGAADCVFYAQIN